MSFLCSMTVPFPYQTPKNSRRLPHKTFRDPQNSKDFFQGHPKRFPQRFLLQPCPENPASGAPHSLSRLLLTSDLVQVGTPVPPAVRPDAQVASVGALHVGHTPIHRAENHQGRQDAEDETTGPQDELVVIPGRHQLYWERREFWGPGSTCLTLWHSGLHLHA